MRKYVRASACTQIDSNIHRHNKTSSMSALKRGLTYVRMHAHSKIFRHTLAEYVYACVNSTFLPHVDEPVQIGGSEFIEP